MTSLNPLHTVEKQVSEVLKIHHGMSNTAARSRTLELLMKVGIRDPESRLGAYPHQLSGGQRQRVMIAMALANEPDLLIADEPTTALDVTIQAQILDLLKDLQRELGMALLLITHDLGIVRKMADRTCVMKDGEIVERGPAEEIFAAPKHPYTKRLIEAEPKGQAPLMDETAPVVLEADNLKVWFPIKQGILHRTVDNIKAVDGVSFKLQDRANARHRRRSPAPARPPSASQSSASSQARGRSPMSANGSTGSGRRTCGRSARKCRWCSKTPTARSARGFRWARSSRKVF